MTTSTSRPVHRFVTIEQVTRATQPEASDLDTLFAVWGLTHATQEAMWVIALDNVEGIKIVTEVARGGFHDVVISVPAVLAAVLAVQTDRFYIAHNHPSGPVTPTEEDVTMTGQIMAAANAAGLSFEDSLIVGPEGRFSFWEAGLLQRAESLRTVVAAKKGRR